MKYILIAIYRLFKYKKWILVSIKKEEYKDGMYNIYTRMINTHMIIGEVKRIGKDIVEFAEETIDQNLAVHITNKILNQ